MKKDRKKLIWEYAKAIITALLLALLIRAYIIQAFKIPSGSMVPTLLVGDHLLVNKFLYGTKIPFSDKRIFVFRKPEREDIIVFKYPEDPKRDFIKRVIGTEGDVIESKDKVIYVNGRKLIESYAQHGDRFINQPCPNPTVDKNNPCHRDNFGPIIVPEGKVFVMGDNRDYSHDSRFWGFVDLKEIKGKALIVYWSWDTNKWLRYNRIGRLIN